MMPLSDLEKIFTEFLALCFRHTLTFNEFSIIKIMYERQEALDASTITNVLEQVYKHENNIRKKNNKDLLKVPIYRTVKRILEDLVSMGLLIKRKLEGSKVKALFALTPQVIIKLYKKRGAKK